MASLEQNPKTAGTQHNNGLNDFGRLALRVMRHAILPCTCTVHRILLESEKLAYELCVDAATADPRTIHHGRLNGVQHRTQTRAIQTWGGIETGGITVN